MSLPSRSTDPGGGGGHAGEQLRGGDGDHAAAPSRRREGGPGGEAVGGRGGLVPHEVPRVRHREEDRQGTQDAHQAHAPQVEVDRNRFFAETPKAETAYFQKPNRNRN